MAPPMTDWWQESESSDEDQDQEPSDGETLNGTDNKLGAEDFEVDSLAAVADASLRVENWEAMLHRAPRRPSSVAAALPAPPAAAVGADQQPQLT